MKISSFALALALALAPASIGVAQAGTVEFSFSGDDGFHSYFVSNPPPLDVVQTNAFISHDTASNALYFYGIDVGGGIQDSVGYFQGVQLYSGSESSPTILTGTYLLTNINTGGLDTLSITSVPEPSTWALMGLGFASLGFAARRNTRRTAMAV